MQDMCRAWCADTFPVCRKAVVLSDVSMFCDANFSEAVPTIQRIIHSSKYVTMVQMLFLILYLS